MSIIDIDGIKKLIPHRPPFLFIDEVVRIEKGVNISALKQLKDGDSIFEGHFPGFPIMPGVLIVEAIAQTAGVLIAYSFADALEDRMVYLYSIDRADFRNRVHPGDKLILNVSSSRIRNFWRCEGEAFVGDDKVAEASFVLVVKKNDK